MANPIYPDITLTIGKSPLPPIKGSYRYFDFSQNNSGGSFKRDEDLGDHVLIAAKDAKDANERLQELGGYFNGCQVGTDCDCCGDRWYPVWHSDEGKADPVICERIIPAYMQQFGWPGKQIVVHHADGSRDVYKLDGDDE